MITSQSQKQVVNTHVLARLLTVEKALKALTPTANKTAPTKLKLVSIY